MSTVPCPHCSTQYAKGHPRQRYCSDDCREAARNARKRKPAQVVPCKECGQDFTATRTMKFCTYECGKKYHRAIELQRNRAKPKQPRKAHEPKSYPATCTVCNELYEARSEKSKYCTEKCRFEERAKLTGKRDCRRCGAALTDTHYARRCPPCQVLNKREAQANAKRAGRERGEAWATMRNHRQRAKHYGVPYESINRLRIYERDGWRCGICTKQIDQELKHPHPMAVSLDHIVPISRGGGHLKTNVQASHWQCNIDKGANLDGAQELLFA